MGCKIRDSKVEDIEYLAKNMRKEDKDEIMASHGVEPLEAIEVCVEDAYISKVVEKDGDPIIIYGITKCDEMENFVAVWMLSTDRINEIKCEFLRGSRVFIEECLKEFKVLANIVDVRNEVSVKWLKWLGAIIYDPEPLGIHGEMFSMFEFRR